MALTTLPPATCADIAALMESRFVDFCGIIRSVSDTRPGGGRTVRDVVLVDGTKTPGSELLASPSLTVWTLAHCRKFDGDTRGKIIAVYNAKATLVNNELKLHTTDQSQIEFPTEIPNFDNARLQRMIENADEILGKADEAGVENLTATWVPRETAAPVDASGLADHSVCALAAAGLTSETESSLLQMVLANVDIPVERPLTKDGKRVFFPSVVRDMTGAVPMTFTEEAAFGLAQDIQTKDEFMEAWENNTLVFPPANIRFVRRVRKLDKDSKDPDTEARTFTELLAAAACPTDLTLHPTDASRDVFGYLRSTGRTTGAVLPALLKNVHTCPINGLCVRMDSEPALLPVCKILVLVKGRRGTKSKLDTMEGGIRRVVTADVVCPYSADEAVAAEGDKCCYNVIAHCTEENMLTYKIDGQTVLLSVTQATKNRAAEGEELKMNLIVDAVYPVLVGDVRSQSAAWKAYIELGKHTDLPETETPRKCRKLEQLPSDTSVSALAA